MDTGFWGLQYQSLVYSSPRVCFCYFFPFSFLFLSLSGFSLSIQNLSPFCLLSVSFREQCGDSLRGESSEFCNKNKARSYLHKSHSEAGPVWHLEHLQKDTRLLQNDLHTCVWNVDGSSKNWKASALLLNHEHIWFKCSLKGFSSTIPCVQLTDTLLSMNVSVHCPLSSGCRKKYRVLILHACFQFCPHGLERLVHREYF